MDNNTDIIEFFETLITDTLDADAEMVLLNQADAVIRAIRPWEILKSEDSTKSRSSGDTFQTAKVQPTDFHRPHKIYIGDNQLPPLKRIRFEDRRKFQNAAGYYCIDFKNGNLYITNGTWTGVIYNTYIYKPLRLALSADATHLNAPVFPSDYYPYYAYKMAEIYMGGIDEDDRSIAAVPQWVKTAKEIWEAMVTWDAELKENDLLQETYQDSESLPVIDLGRLGL